MRKTVLFTAVAALLATGVLSARGGHFGYGHAGGWYNPGKNITTPIVSELTQEQKDDLIFMYQEEKMARDVYITLGNKWGARVFLNIQKSEQTHMNAIKALLDKYSLEVPIDSSDVGHFVNEEIQALYDQLVAKGNNSLEDALEVGVAIEETDIADLEEKIENAPSDIARVYSRLLRGSYNHLRAFNANLGN